MEISPRRTVGCAHGRFSSLASRELILSGTEYEQVSLPKPKGLCALSLRQPLSHITPRLNSG
jgi:hypothetical protein